METFFETLFGELLRGFLKGMGALIRWIFQHKKSYKEVYGQEWNTRIGFFFFLLLIILLVLIIN